MKTKHLVAGLLTAATLTACNHRELCYDHSHGVEIDISFDWSMAPDATPRTMVVCFFPREGGEPLRYETVNTTGITTVRLTAGSYDAVAFNGDTETLREKGSTFADFVITTDDEDMLAPMGRVAPTDVPPRAEGTEDEPVKTAPETLWAAAAEGGVIFVAARAGQSVEFTPVEATDRYHITFNNVKNLGRAASYSATLTSLSEHFSPGLMDHGGRRVTVPIALTARDDNSLHGDIETFGHCPGGSGNDHPARHILTVYTSDRKYYTFDVTDQLHNAANPHEINISIDGLEFPDPPKPDQPGGMSPTVNDWEETIIYDLDMN